MHEAIDTRFRPELRGFLLALILAALGAAGAVVAGGALAGAERNSSPPGHQPARQSGGAATPSIDKQPAPENANPESAAGVRSPTASAPRSGSPSGGSSPGPSSRDTGTGTGPTQISGSTALEPAVPPPAPSDGGNHAAEQNPVGGGQAAPRDPLD